MSWWQYLLLVNLYLVLFYGFYTLLLRAETFFQLNRIYLVTSALLSFIIPVIHADWIRNLFITQKVQQTLSVYSAPILIHHFKPIEDRHLTIGEIMLFIYATGAVILIVKFIWQLISLKKIIDQPEEAGAFSFFRSIRLGANSDDQNVIEAHEQVHARQWHSADVLLVEAIAIINWFNPVVYFYRLAIKHIHEFIADKQALDNGTDKAEYALLLLSQTLRAPAHQLVNPFFNNSLLKQRIIMLQKSRSQWAALLKYGLSAPLFILMLILSSATISRSTT
ncbi:MAG: M56 family metallopeptidase, partial [Mucilaginibacter sp.]